MWGRIGITSVQIKSIIVCRVSAGVLDVLAVYKALVHACPSNRKPTTCASAIEPTHGSVPV